MAIDDCGKVDTLSQLNVPQLAMSQPNNIAAERVVSYAIAAERFASNNVVYS